jgi:hypothetical protein
MHAVKYHVPIAPLKENLKDALVPLPRPVIGLNVPDTTVIGVPEHKPLELYKVTDVYGVMPPDKVTVAVIVLGWLVKSTLLDERVNVAFSSATSENSPVFEVTVFGWLSVTVAQKYSLFDGVVTEKA